MVYHDMVIVPLFPTLGEFLSQESKALTNYSVPLLMEFD